MIKRTIILFLTGVAIFSAVPFLIRNNPMTENKKHLKQAQELIKAFETEKEPERLNEASMSLENVNLAQEYDLTSRHQLRAECLALHLTLLQILDKYIDPKFNPDDVPSTVVQPHLSDGRVLRPGVDPAKISDPQDRAEYEKAIAENRAKARNYSLQTELRRLNERIPPRAEEFIRNSYTSSADDQKELKTAIDEKIENEARRAELSKLLTASQP
jgi:hypothetical protein